MKRISVIAGIVLVLMLTLVLLPTANAQAITPTPPPAAEAVDAPVACDPTRTVLVNGTALINVVPDRALIQLGVQTNGVSPSMVAKDNTSIIQEVIKKLMDLGIEEKDIATDLYYVEPVYSSYDSLTIKGYRINNTIAVTLRDVKQVNEVITTALESGANQVINVELYTSELRKYRDQARELAVKAAGEKANLLAGSAGAQTDCVLNVTENIYSYYNGWWMGRTSNIWAQNITQNAAPGTDTSALSEAGAVSLGQISVRAEVTITYSLK